MRSRDDLDLQVWVVDPTTRKIHMKTDLKKELLEELREPDPYLKKSN